MFKLVEKNDHNALHALFDNRERAERHLQVIIPDYVKRGLFSDKTLTADSFEIIEGSGPGSLAGRRCLVRQDEGLTPAKSIRTT